MLTPRSFFDALERILVSVVDRCIPSRRAPSRFSDLFHGVFLSAVVVGLVQPIEPVPDLDAAPPADWEPPSIEETIERFAPEVRFHPQERYYPSSVEWFLERAQLRHDSVDQAVGELSASVVPAVYEADDNPHMVDWRSSYLTVGEGRDRARVLRGDLDSAHTYVHVRQADNGSAAWDIQYWFFYPYSGPLIDGPAGGAHEGDWEHITVRLDSSWREVEKVYFAAHNADGRWVAPSEVRFREGTHPVVYVARNGHASYPRPGLHPRGFLPSDRTADGGVVWRTWQSTPQLVADQDGGRDGFGWLAYPGRWGSSGSLSSGPLGPAFQAYWSQAP
jgi:hypothetical protein